MSLYKKDRATLDGLVVLTEEERRHGFRGSVETVKDGTPKVFTGWCWTQSVGGKTPIRNVYGYVMPGYYKYSPQRLLVVIDNGWHISPEVYGCDVVRITRS